METTETIPKPNERPSTAGMTTKVVKGSLWTLTGQVAPLAVSLVTTPFVIRMLGAEGYGVLVLIALIPAYFGFVDLGMSIASTRFASEAYAAGLPKGEARVVRTAALIALIASTPVAMSLFIFSGSLVVFLNVPDHLRGDAALAIKFAAVAFVINLLNAIFNTPQLTRLRMDLNTFITAGFRMAGLIATPLILFLGGSIATVAFALMVTSILNLVGHLLVSRRLLPHLFESSIDTAAVGAMVRYGAALAGAGLAGVLLVHLEKVVLVRTTSVETLAYYSAAFTLAMMATTLSASMTQSLVPAFSQLLDPQKRSQLESLFLRALRLNIIVMLPVLALLLAVARPFFTIWAGEDFGRESTIPFYILMLGLFFAVNNYAPISLLMASGRAGIIAKIYWAELIPYVGLAALLTTRFGAEGAASAWALRAMADTVLVSWVAARKVGISYKLPSGSKRDLLLLLGTIAPLLCIAFLTDSSYTLVLVLPIFIVVYCALTWNKFLASEEKIWLLNRLNVALNR